MTHAKTMRNTNAVSPRAILPVIRASLPSRDFPGIATRYVAVMKSVNLVRLVEPFVPLTLFRAAFVIGQI